LITVRFLATAEKTPLKLSGMPRWQAMRILCSSYSTIRLARLPAEGSTGVRFRQRLAKDMKMSLVYYLWAARILILAVSPTEPFSLQRIEGMKESFNSFWITERTSIGMIGAVRHSIWLQREAMSVLFGFCLTEVPM
jgi:hypothetical protein